MIDTARMVLRPWREEHIAPFLAMGQDAEVMRYLGPPLSLADARAAYERMVARQAKQGMCFWAVERKADAAFLGFCGLQAGYGVLLGETEIGWRLRRDAWGQGYAREAAAASLLWGWANLAIPSITAITVPANTQSWKLMERLCMRRCPEEDFNHPDLAPDDPLRPHILYRIDRPTA